MSEKLFAVNISHGNLSLKQGYITIPFGSYKDIDPSDKEHPDFKDAYSRKWLTYSDTEPTPGSLPKVDAIEFVEPNKGLTAEELKAELAKDKEKVEATTEALGQSETVTGEPVVTKLGQDTEAEGKKSRSKKAE